MVNGKYVLDHLPEVFEHLDRQSSALRLARETLESVHINCEGCQPTVEAALAAIREAEEVSPTYSVWLHRRGRRPKKLYRGASYSEAAHYYTQAQALTEGRFSATILRSGKTYATRSFSMTGCSLANNVKAV